MNPLISVVIPVYNAENYLQKCLDSVINQSYRNFELILINDGSTDKSDGILNNFDFKDISTSILSVENSGVSNARNLGINTSKGEFICFIDADDWVEIDYLLNFVQNLDSKEILIIQDIFKNNQLLSYYHNQTLPLKNNFNKILVNHRLLYNGSPFAKLYNRKIIIDNGLKFNKEIHYGEDQIFFYQYLQYIPYIKLLAYAGYHYDYNNQSLSTKKHPFTSFLAYFTQFQEFLIFVKNNNPNQKISYKICDFGWDIVESSIDQGLIATKAENSSKQLRKISNSLDKDYLYKDLSLNRKIIFVLLKLKLFTILLWYKKMLAKING